ncbi:MAG: type II toxin-antitoxin system mRNA interferase toxin, RelE/StbE family [Dysgonamonadaceae bacterium]|jgi:addiction module RelE/StbE family toxin|nr:type II toxin-antitoxin system mRNA interferase toxin, RelE/StbE family [Dysgonamonadaceae bacterium]
MKIEYHRNFTKQFEKLQRNEQVRVIEVLKLFANEPFAEKLRNHQLKAKLSKFRSISAGGDIRLHYYEKEPNHVIVVFVAIGSHSELY